MQLTQKVYVTVLADPALPVACPPVIKDVLAIFWVLLEKTIHHNISDNEYHHHYDY